MRLTDNKILLKEPEDTKTAGGIFLPSNSQAGFREYVVHEVGPGQMNYLKGKRIPMFVKKGDHVLVDRSIMAEITISKKGNKETYYLVSEQAIKAVLEEGERF